MNTKTFIFITVAFLFFTTQLAHSQQTTPQRQRGGEEVLMLEEIRIEVGPELPTVVVSIPRQKPEIKPVVLNKELEIILSQTITRVKPRLTDMTVSKVEDSKKMLAKERSR